MPTVGIHRPWVMLHIPKTGCTWCHEVLEKNKLGEYCREWSPKHAHMPPSMHPEVENPSTTQRTYDCEGRFTFAFVREPFAWYGSLWSYLSYHRVWASPGKLRVTTPEFSKTIPSFSQWVEWMTSERVGFLSTLYDKFVGPTGREINFIGRTENLSTDLLCVMQGLGEGLTREKLHQPVNVVGQLPTWERRWAHDFDSRRRIRDSESSVYERFNY